MKGWIQLMALYETVNKELARLDIQKEEESYYKEEWFQVCNILSITYAGETYSKSSSALLHVGTEEVYVQQTVEEVLELIRMSL